MKPITTSKKELLDLFKAWIAIGVAFAIVMNGISFGPSFLLAFAISLLTVGIGFIIHEMSHKIIAQRFNCWAEFRSDDKMLLFAVVMSLLGFVFAAPGAVMIRGRISNRQNGMISSAGPASNIAVSLVFLALFLTSASPLFQVIGSYGFRINAWLALFNMIPIGIFDGAKIWRFNKTVYIGLAAIALGLIVVQNII